ncbi:MAG: GvpL/GvpF family gas vesicle protein [Cyanobacteria bacterium P01_G01_bin.38]
MLKPSVFAPDVMSALYLYAFCWLPRLREATALLPAGLNQPIQIISEGDIGAAIERGIDLTAMEQDDIQLVAGVVNHDRVICDLFELAPLLPLRFGTQFLSETALRSHLQDKAAQYCQRLQFLTDQVEICFRLTPVARATPPVDHTLKGGDYFLAKKQRLQNQATHQQHQQKQLSQLQGKIAHTFPHLAQEATPDTLEQKIYLLIKGDQLSQLPAHLTTWQTAYPLWTITASEARPPYHFVQ